MTIICLRFIGQAGNDEKQYAIIPKEQDPAFIAGVRRTLWNVAVDVRRRNPAAVKKEFIDQISTALKKDSLGEIILCESLTL
jgi:hypothetical protein